MPSLVERALWLHEVITPAEGAANELCPDDVPTWIVLLLAPSQASFALVAVSPTVTAACTGGAAASAAAAHTRDQMSRPLIGAKLCRDHGPREPRGVRASA